MRLKILSLVNQLKKSCLAMKKLSKFNNAKPDIKILKGVNDKILNAKLKSKAAEKVGQYICRKLAASHT